MKKIVLFLLILAIYTVAQPQPMEIVCHEGKIYTMNLKIHQTTYTLDPFEYMKNKANDVTIQIPIDEEFYHSISSGSELSSSWKMGSILLNGDLSKLRLIVTSKSVRPSGKTVCEAKPIAPPAPPKPIEQPAPHKPNAQPAPAKPVVDTISPERKKYSECSETKGYTYCIQQYKSASMIDHCKSVGHQNCGYPPKN